MSIICGEKLNHVTDDDDSHRIIDDKDRVERRDPNPHDDKYTNSERARTPFLSVFGEVSIVRDFFLAAFSDGYNSVNCCSAEGLFPGGEDATCSSSSMKHHNEKIFAKNASLSSSERSRKRRNKPLAVAVGFKCANDYNGRPIVITPGGRNSPNSVVTRSLADPYQNARKKKESDTRTPPRLPDLSVSCNNPGGSANEHPSALLQGSKD